MKSATRKEQKRQFGKMIGELLPLYREYEEKKYSEGEQDSWNAISERMEAMERRTLRRRFFYAVAAAIVFLAIGGISFRLFMGAADEKPIEERVLAFETLSATGKQIRLVTTANQPMDVDDNACLKYENDGTVVVNSQAVDQKIASGEDQASRYNQLIVPKGKRTQIYFADGTHMHVNSGTKVTYPAVFARDKREIYVDGEIYLEVKRDVNRPFYVKTGKMRVQVVGTSFGVCAYGEDKESSVVLVSGKVEVETKTRQKVTLSPDELFSLKETEASKKKVDAFEYVCWTDGLMIFHKESLDHVFTRLSRYYGQEISYENKQGPSYYVSGKLDLRESLEEVMKLVSGFAPITYHKVDDKITVELIDRQP